MRVSRTSWLAALALTLAACTAASSPSTPPPSTLPGASTTTPSVITSPLNGVLEPGMWTVAATFAEPSVPPDRIVAAANEVRSWPGVLEVVEISDQSTWLEVTGLTSECGEVDTGPPCGDGLAVLTRSSLMPLTASRIEADLGMNTLTPVEAAHDFIAGYLKAAIERASPRPLMFDTSPLGGEQRLFGTLDNWRYPMVGLSCGSECFALTSNPSASWVIGTKIDLRDGRDGTMHVELDGTGYTVEDLLVDRFGHGGVLTELHAVFKGTRIYQFAFLPLDAAVITFEQADGTKVWQQPLGGFALLVDSPSSGGSSEWSDDPTAGPFVVLDETGTEIMRIEDSQERSVREDLRIARALTATKALQTDPSDIAVKVEAVATIEDVPSEAMVKVAEDLWLRTDSGLTRVDVVTGEKEIFPVDSWLSRMVSTGDALWLYECCDFASVSRFDLTSRTITDRIALPLEDGRGSDMVVAGGALWVTGPDMGYMRIDPVTLTVETVPGPGSTNWIGEVDGDLWAMSGGRLARIDQHSMTVDRFDTGSHPGGPFPSAVYAGDALWLSNWDLSTIARFDLEELEVTALPVVGRQGVSARGVFAGDGLWFTNAGTQSITRMDPATGLITDVLDVVFGRSHVVGNSLWLVDSRQGFVTHIDAETRQVTELGSLAGDGSYAIAVDGALWIAGKNGTILRVETES